MRTALGTITVALCACGGTGSSGTSVRPDPVQTAGEVLTAALADAPANHGLDPLQQFDLSSGSSQEHGNVEITCPAGGPDCVVHVAADGSIEYETGGGLPSVSLVVFAARDIDNALRDLLADGSAPALTWHAARYPPPEAVICLALVIGCEGGPGPIYLGAPSIPKGPSFMFLGRRGGVFLAEMSQVVHDVEEETTYRALAGWMDHAFFLVETPQGGVVPGRGSQYRRYYSAYSVGNPTETNPDVRMGAAATWSGMMSGILFSEPDTGEPDAFVNGDATVTVSDRPGSSGLVVDVQFSGIRDAAIGWDFEDLRWTDLPLVDGSFGIRPVSAHEAMVSRHPASNGISGRFYGPNHEEVGGVFGRGEVVLVGREANRVHMEVSGAFGAARD